MRVDAAPRLAARMIVWPRSASRASTLSKWCVFWTLWRENRIRIPRGDDISSEAVAETEALMGTHVPKGRQDLGKENHRV